MRVRTKHPGIYKEMIIVMRGGFGDLDSKMGTMIEKQDLWCSRNRSRPQARLGMQGVTEELCGSGARNTRGASQARNSGRGFDEIKSSLMHHGIMC